VDPDLDLDTVQDLDLDPGPDPNPAIFVIKLQDANKKPIFFSAFYFLKVHLLHFSKIKSQKEVIKQ
jgi:hypothetical protein